MEDTTTKEVKKLLAMGIGFALTYYIFGPIGVGLYAIWILLKS